MKIKTILVGSICLAVLLIPATAQAKNLALGIEGGYFAPGNNMFTDVYGSGGFYYGVNGAFYLSDSLAIEAGFTMFHADGTILGTGDETSLNLNTLRFGLFYNFGMKKLTPKIGAGAVYAMAKEENTFGHSSDSGVGWFAGAGLDFRLTGVFLVGVELLYHDVEIEGDFGGESVGGISALFGFKVEI